MADHKAVAKALGPCPHSHSNWKDVVARHYDLHLTVDFKRKILHGHVNVVVEVLNDSKELRLDCKNLAIERVTAGSELLPHTIPINDPTFGSCLSIPLTAVLGKKGNKFPIRIDYSTTPYSGGLQWLEPKQTGTKKLPFMYSQFEAILARTSIPCQDTPAVKAPYSISANVPAPLVAVCSGNADKKNPYFEDDGTLTFKYDQKQPIPAYLIAIVAGSLESRPVGPRSSVWAEKNLIDRAVHEFSADTESYIVAGEKVTGVTYDWGPVRLINTS
jgi:leukotriene-A4 hydrolase